MGIKTILCLDLGTTTGWAMQTKYGHIYSGTESFRPGRFEGGGMRYLRFNQWLAQTNKTAEGIDAIYFEEVRRHVGVDAAHAYGGFLATLTAFCESFGIPYSGIPVGTIKKSLTGKGNARKDQMMVSIRAKGHTPKDDNEADALALLYFVLDVA